ncbi:hypothetical protein L7D48_01635 [Streptomyces sp. S1A]|uniref:hypothetical protein n=1 Tax=Streptomyces sp. ICN903 TaxID=2964654 RepID=UPI001EDC749A|nr:hypothetical protein [Streptomyces sp. ICN903]MCG3039283.1 hypothetical protein [Streptomyces sp. ICN903]
MATATKKTNPTSLAEQIRAKESETLASINAAREAAEQAEERAEETQTEAHQAEAKADNLRAAFGRGEAEASAEEFAAALANVERTSLLAEGTKRKADQLKRAVPHVGKRLAEVVAPIVGRTLPGVPVVATFTKPDAPSSVEGLPLLAVVEQVCTANKSGALSGTVELHYFRTAVHVQPDPRNVETAFMEQGFGLRSITGLGHRSIGDVRVDILRLDVAYAYEAAPVIAARVDEKAAEFIARGVASTFIMNAPIPAAADAMIQRSDDGRELYGKGLAVRILGGRVEKVPAASDGVRRHVVDVAFEWRFTRIGNVGRLNHSDITKTLQAVEESYAGQLIPNAGVIEKVERFVPEADDKATQTRAHTEGVTAHGFRFVVASREQ